MAAAGDTAAVLKLLDAGWDPLVRDGDTGQAVLHLLPRLDHSTLLPRLLAAGADINALDHAGRGPLQTAVCGGGSPALVAALLEAGADPAPFAKTLFWWLEGRRQDPDFLVEYIDNAKTARTIAA